MEPTVLCVSTTNQWALDFKGNEARIAQSVKDSVELHEGRVRLGSELEIPGYMCEDHFYEPDTIYHSWEVLANLMRLTSSPPYDSILCTFGMAVNHRGVIYNCGVITCGGIIYLIKPKLILADDGNYRESRWFTPWKGGTCSTEFALPSLITEATGQKTCAFGNAMIQTSDGYLVGSECCEEMWAPIPSSNSLFLQGAHIVLNTSGSHFHLRKLSKREDLIKIITTKTGGIYLYSNQRGCDGNRLYFDGASMIAVNGKIVAMGDQFDMREVQIVSATVDLCEVEAFRSPANARALQANETVKSSFPIIQIPNFELLMHARRRLSRPKILAMPCAEEQIAYGTACWLWDYLRRSNASGFFLPISGGADSSSTLAIAGIMCQFVIDYYERSSRFNKEVFERDLRRLCGDDIPTKPKELAARLIHCAYLGTKNSSTETLKRAETLAEEVGASFYHVNIDKVIASQTKILTSFISCEEPRFKSQGGTQQEDLALQNIQARSRMLMSYLLGQLLPTKRGDTRPLLVLGSANLEEGLTGYMTKYDCSSADINPIGGISKTDLKSFMIWAAHNKGYPSLLETADAPPTAELRPQNVSAGEVQTDEADLGLTYKEMSMLGFMRKAHHLGPFFTYKKLKALWTHLTPKEIGDKVKNFYVRYGKNRHKMTVVTPSLHVENYSADDNRFDMRPILYNYKWDAQFAEIDEDILNS